MKTCRVCGLEQDLNQFRVNSRTCKSCCRKQKNNKRRANREKLIGYKKTLSCSKCGFSDHRALEFHHVDPSIKDGNIATLIHDHPFEYVLNEINKCVVLCANCHRIEHSDSD